MKTFRLTEHKIERIISHAIYKALYESEEQTDNTQQPLPQPDNIDDLYRYLKQHEGEDGFFCERPTRKKRQLLFHFTGPDEAEEIMRNGFTIGTTLEHLKNTEMGYHSDENGKYDFAYDLKTFVNDWYGCSAYGCGMVVLIADSIRFYHKYDGEIQYMFINSTAKPIAAFELDIDYYSWGPEATFIRLDKDMRPCTSLRELFTSEFGKELAQLGYDPYNIKTLNKIFRY